MNELFYQALLIEIQKNFSKKSAMVNELVEILRIEKGAVYRRLRQEVPFTFNEIAIIAKHLKISLDNMIGIEVNKSALARLRLPDFISPQEEDYRMFDSFSNFLRKVNQLENSEMVTVSNILPQVLFFEFRYLLIFYLFKWNYHYNNDKVKPFHQIAILPELNKHLSEFAIEIRKFNKFSYVFDSKMFRILVNDIIFFYSIRLIEKEDVVNLKENLLSLLDSLENMAIDGQFKETGKPINLYISDIAITTNYTYVEAGNIHFSMIRAFTLSSVTSFDEKVFEKMKKWIHSLIKLSTLITLTNERQRVLYFEEQRKIIDELQFHI